MAAKTITIFSNKGGVGKTNASVNLGVALAATNRKVMILDADLGLAGGDLRAAERTWQLLHQVKSRPRAHSA